MTDQKCYIEFEISNELNFNDLKEIFDKIKEAKNTGQPKSDQFWLDSFPKYSIEEFYFGENDLKPDFPTSDLNEFTWHFYSLTSLLQTDYDIEYLNCFKQSDKVGTIDYNPFNYPYGGITGLIVFIKSFNCRPTMIDDGTGLYSITFLNNGDFSIADINNPNRPDSSKKRFDGLQLIRDFINRINKKNYGS